MSVRSGLSRRKDAAMMTSTEWAQADDRNIAEIADIDDVDDDPDDDARNVMCVKKRDQKSGRSGGYAHYHIPEL